MDDDTALLLHCCIISFIVGGCIAIDGDHKEKNVTKFTVSCIANLLVGVIFYSILLNSPVSGWEGAKFTNPHTGVW